MRLTVIRICVASSLVTFALACSLTACAGEPVPVLDYLGQRAAQLAAQLPPVAKSVEGWEKQRTELRAQLTKTLGLPAREPMKAAVTYSKPSGDLVLEEVTFLWAEPTYATATVLRSQKAQGRQAALVMPSGWLGHWTFRPYRKFVEHLARQGCVVLFIDDPRTGQRQAPYAGLYATASAAGLQVAGLQVFDALRGLDYLLTRADVDPGKIGLAGMGEGAIQAYLAAAMESKFQFVVAVGGTTTYAALVQAAAQGAGPEDPSAYVSGLLQFADLDRVVACLAPRPLLIAGPAKTSPQVDAGRDQVLQTATAVYGLYKAEPQLRQLPGASGDDMTPYAPEVARWLETSVLPALPASTAAPAACAAPEKPEFSLLAFVQRRIAAQTAAAAPAASPARRTELAQWLRQACALDSLKPAADKVGKVTEADGLVTEQLGLGLDGEFRCPAILMHPAAVNPAKHAAVVLSHDDRQCAASGKLVDAARQLAAAGYWVLVPDHASLAPQSLQPLVQGPEPGFYSDEAARLYGPADAVGLSPLALRVAEDLAGFRCLAARAEVAPQQIVFAGLGLGGVDACLAALLEDRAAGAAAVDATTLRDWCQTVAPGELRFQRLSPYLPGMLTKGDLDSFLAALAPKPLLVARQKDGWPRSGFEQVAATTLAAYKQQQAEGQLLATDARGIIEQAEAGQAAGIRKQLLAVARTLVPTPPKSGLVGNPEGVKQRPNIDSASGLIWVMAEADGYDQQFAGSGFQLQTWSFFNRHNPAQNPTAVTPLIFKKEGDKYLLTAIGKTRQNTGAGLQEHPFEPLSGVATVGEDYYFGFYTGDAAGKPNAGVVEYEDAPDSRMTILTADGQMDGQRLKLGEAYRLQSEYPRRYSVMAVSKKP